MTEDSTTTALSRGFAVPHAMFDQHHQMLEQAVEACRTRSYWSAFPEVPSGKIYGETAKDDGIKAFQARLGQTFELAGHPTNGKLVGSERSPYGIGLNIQYPQADLADLVAAAQEAMAGWRTASPEDRAGVCLEMLKRLNQRSFELAFAVMHTTGQAFMMAFQAGGPHAQDRGLEAVAYAYEEQKRTPATATWRKQVSKTDVITLEKQFRIVPRGVAVMIGCSTFPTWNGYPGMFASLATGNALVIKPHPGAVLPLAISAEIMRDVLRDNGFDPNLVTLAVDTHDEPITKDLVTRPEVKIVDYTGSSHFGEWVEQNARQAVVFTEKAGINSTIIDSIDDLKATTGNLAFSLCLYSGQMCTTPQNIFIPRDGAQVGGEHKSFDEIAGGIVKAVDWLLSDENRAVEILGAIQNEATAKRIDQAATEGPQVVRPSAAIKHPMFPEARVRTPLILKADARDRDKYMREMFGPIVYLIATDSTAHSIGLAAETAEKVGAITCGIYSGDEKVLDNACDATSRAGVPLSCNLVGQIYVNQSAAFSDFHVSGANPSGNATLCDSAFVANRFRVVQSRRVTPAATAAS